MRPLLVILALVLYALAIPAGLRAERAAAQAGPAWRFLFESARCLLAIVAATALLVTALWGAP